MLSWRSRSCFDRSPYTGRRKFASPWSRNPMPSGCSPGSPSGTECCDPPGLTSGCLTCSLSWTLGTRLDRNHMLLHCWGATRVHSHILAVLGQGWQNRAAGSVHYLLDKGWSPPGWQMWAGHEGQTRWRPSLHWDCLEWPGNIAKDEFVVSGTMSKITEYPQLTQTAIERCN